MENNYPLAPNLSMAKNQKYTLKLKNGVIGKRYFRCQAKNMFRITYDVFFLGQWIVPSYFCVILSVRPCSCKGDIPPHLGPRCGNPIKNNDPQNKRVIMAEI